MKGVRVFFYGNWKSVKNKKNSPKCVKFCLTVGIDGDKMIPMSPSPKQSMDTYNIDGHKIHYHPERVAQWASDPKNTFPIYVEVSPVGHCNHRCTFCAVDYLGYITRSIDTRVMCRAITNMAMCGVKSIMFAGEGEPLLHKELPSIVNTASDANIDVAITTNGTALTDRFIDTCLDNVTWLKVSCNAGDAKTYARIHQTRESDFERVWKNIYHARARVKNVERATDPRHYKKPVIGVQVVLLPDNKKSIEGLIRHAIDADLDYVVIKPYSQHGMSVTTKYKDIVYDTDYRTLCASWEAMSTDTCKVIIRRNAMDAWNTQDRGYKTCLSTPYFWAYVMSTGDVYGCSAYLGDDRFKYGNLYDDAFMDIWLGDKRQENMEYVKCGLDISECRKNCRMHAVNQYLWDVQKGVPHGNFI